MELQAQSGDTSWPNPPALLLPRESEGSPPFSGHPSPACPALSVAQCREVPTVPFRGEPSTVSLWLLRDHNNGPRCAEQQLSLRRATSTVN